MNDAGNKLCQEIDGLLGFVREAKVRYLAATETEIVSEKVRKRVLQHLNGAEVDLRRAQAHATGTKDEYDEMLDKRRKRTTSDLPDFGELEALARYA